MNELDELCGAYNEVGHFYDENMHICRWFSQRMMTVIQKKEYQTLISLGVGYTAVNQSIAGELGQLLSHYWIVDGSQMMLDKVRQEVKLSTSTHLVQSWFEIFDPHCKVDAIEMGFVLEHVDDPLGLIKHYASFLNDGGTLFIAVPNAQSLHRRIGQAAGMLDNLYQLSEYDLGFGHQRYFDVQSLTEMVEQAGLAIQNTEGIMLKPITTGQLQHLELDEKVMNALFEVGINYPELSNCIYLEATL